MHIQRISCNYLQDKDVNRYSNNNRVSFERASYTPRPQQPISLWKGVGIGLKVLFCWAIALWWGAKMALSAVGWKIRHSGSN